MKTTSRAVAALLLTTISFGAAVPALAQSSPAVTPAHGPHGGQWIEKHSDRPMMRLGLGGPGGMGGGLIALACSPNGAEMLDAFLLHLSYRLALTDAQKPLYDALREKALTAQTKFADTCQAAMPAEDVTVDALTRLKSSIAIDTAKLEALNSILPELEAFFASLTDEQKALLMPDRGPDASSGDGPRRFFFRFGPMGDHDMGPMAPGR